jgi:hypothetical protein
MGKTKATRKAWRRRAFKKLGTRSLSNMGKQDRSNVLRRVLGMLEK